MRRFLLALGISSFTLCAQAAPICPQNLLQLPKGGHALALIKSFKPFVLEQMEENKCKPKTTAHFALGAPLCMFAGELPVTVLGLTALAADDHVAGALYTIDYTPETHARLLALLRKEYEELAPAHYPDRLARMSITTELTALFKSAGMYVALTKPSKGMPPGNWTSDVQFVDMAYPDVFTRDLNSCD